MELTLHPVGDRDRPLGDQGGDRGADGDGIRISRTLQDGEISGVVLESGGGAAPADTHRDELDAAVPDDTAALLAAAGSTVRPTGALAGDGRHARR